MTDITVTLQSGDEITIGALTTKESYTLNTSTGIAGPIGYTGSVGFTGSTGQIGFTGSFGFTGSEGVGFTGSSGGLGYTGSIGFIGSSGIIGFTGSQGDIGYTGSIGSLGFTGSIGFAGSEGSGFTGSQGDIGYTGSQGDLQQTFNTIINANGVVIHDCTNSQLFNHTSISSSFTANFTNLSLANNYATTVTLILNQGATAYVANSVQISGVGQTVLWQGNTASPTGTSNKTDIMSFSILNNSGTYTVFGQLTSFG